jgi:hypothetical protein
MPNYPLQIMKDSASSVSFDTRNQLAESDPFLEMNYKRAWLCNRVLSTHLYTHECYYYTSIVFQLMLRQSLDEVTQ